MKRIALIACVLAAGCGPTMYANLDSPSTPLDDRAFYVGETLAKTISWTCDGSLATGAKGTCMHSVVLTPHPCDGGACRITMAPTETGNRASVYVKIALLAAGHLSERIDAQLPSGAVQVYPFDVNVIPAPVVQVSCTIRDVSSAGLLPCPAPIPHGAEVNMIVTATGVASSMSLVIEPREPSQQGAGYQTRHCTKVPSNVNDTQIRRCTETLPAGHNTLLLRFGHLPEQRLDVDVASRS